VKIVERLTKGESKKKKINKSHEAYSSGGRRYFYFCDTWCHKSRGEVGGNPPQTEKPRSQGTWLLNPVDIRGVKRWSRALAGPGWPWPRQVGALVLVPFFFHFFFGYFRFCIYFAYFFGCFMFCTCTCLKLCFFGGSLYFFVPMYGFKILFKSVASSIFFCTSIFSNLVFMNFCLKFLSQCRIYNFCFKLLWGLFQW
jgi:hypothetical protein